MDKRRWVLSVIAMVFLVTPVATVTLPGKYRWYRSQCNICMVDSDVGNSASYLYGDWIKPVNTQTKQLKVDCKTRGNKESSNCLYSRTLHVPSFHDDAGQTSQFIFGDIWCWKSLVRFVDMELKRELWFGDIRRHAKNHAVNIPSTSDLRWV